MTHTLESLRSKINESINVLKVVPEVKRAFNKQEDIVENRPFDHYVRCLVWERLNALGIYETDDSHDLLMGSECAEGEARRVFCEDGDPRIPPIRFKKLWSILKGGADSELKSDVEKLIEANRPVSEWKDEKLIDEYGPDNDFVIEELKKRSNGKPFVAYPPIDSGASEFNKRVTLDMLKEARKHKSAEIHDLKDGDQFYVLKRAGEFPGMLHSMCPIHDNLLVKDYCSECGEVWHGVDDDARGFIKIMCDEGAGPKSSLEIKAIIGMAKEGFDKLSSEFPQIHMLYHRLKARNQLPSLKHDGESDVKDPFRPGGKTY